MCRDSHFILFRCKKILVKMSVLLSSDNSKCNFVIIDKNRNQNGDYGYKENYCTAYNIVDAIIFDTIIKTPDTSS